MQTTVTERGQTSIPSEIRKRFKIKAGMGIEWVILPEGIYLMPVPEDPIKAVRGKYKGLFETFMESRHAERAREAEQDKKRMKNE